MCYERDYNTPLFEKDKRYCECETCEGLGYQYFEVDAIDEGVNLEKMECPYCEGSGVLEIED